MLSTLVYLVLLIQLESRGNLDSVQIKLYCIINIAGEGGGGTQAWEGNSQCPPLPPSVYLPGESVN